MRPVRGCLSREGDHPRPDLNKVVTPPGAAAFVNNIADNKHAAYTASSRCAVDQEISMTFDASLAERIRGLLPKRGVTEKRMFGGLAFMLKGNMCCGVHKGEMIVRMAPVTAEAALRRAHTRPFDLSGRPIKGWLLVSGKGVLADEHLQEWVHDAVEFARSLPAAE
jgi:TfoX N-terminal domain